MKMNRVWRRLVLGMALTLNCSCAEFAREIRLSDCKSGELPAALAKDEAWKRLERFVVRCAVTDVRKATKLIVVSVSAPAYYAAQKGKNVDQIALPAARILGAQGEAFGKLPYAFPDDPPVSMRLRFLEWRDGQAQRIEMRISDPTASGNRTEYLRWRAEKKEYLPENSGK